MKIGDVVRWEDVPSGALVQNPRGTIYMRVVDYGWCVGDTSHISCAFGRYCDGDEETPWLWGLDAASLTILALGLTGTETVETLSMIVRHFEGRDGLGATSHSG